MLEFVTYRIKGIILQDKYILSFKMSTTKTEIIVPIDFSEQSKIALNQSYNIARFTHSDITLLHVIDEASFSAMFHLFSNKDEQEELLRASLQKQLDEMAADAKAKSGLEIHTRIEKGKIYDKVNEVATDINASFVVMGTSGESTLKKKFIGSNAVRVISECPCPVITIKGTQHKQGCETIVLPLDLSKETKEKVDKCIEIAKFFKSNVKVVSITNTDDEFIVNKLVRQMNQVVEFISQVNINCTGEIMKSHSISDTVIEFAEKVNADLIIIMTQQELEWTEFFIGTESQKIINHSDIPVCSIRPVIKKNLMEYVIS